jgi:hypothetical protein
MGAIPSFIYLLLALAAFAIAGGLIIWVSSYIKAKDERNSQKADRSPTPAKPSNPGISEPKGEQELLCVSRTSKGGLAVSVQGQRYGHLREIKDPQVGRETVEALKAVLAFAEGWLPTARETPPQPAPRNAAVDEEAFLEQLRRSNLFSADTPAPVSQPEPLIPVEQIDELVQKRLQEHPDLTEQRVHLTTEADGNLYIYVGQQTFEAVGDIPDPNIRALIQDAIREWEGD